MMEIWRRPNPLARESYHSSKLLTAFAFVRYSNVSDIDPKTVF
jgi:hypothetical protein